MEDAANDEPTLPSTVHCTMNIGEARSHLHEHGAGGAGEKVPGVAGQRGRKPPAPLGTPVGEGAAQCQQGDRAGRKRGGAGGAARVILLKPPNPPQPMAIPPMSGITGGRLQGVQRDGG